MRASRRARGPAGALESGRMSEIRTPSPAPARIAPLPNLPLFHKLEGRKALVVGDSDGARWKAELLAAAGADVVHNFAWTEEDFQGAALAVADLPGAEAGHFAAAARAASVPVNMIDR